MANLAQIHTQVPLTMQGRPFATPSLGPVWFDLCGFIRIVQGVGEIFLGSICPRSIGIQDMVCRFELNGLREFVTTASQNRLSDPPVEDQTYMASSNFFS